MAFTVEDGTGLEDANALITVEFADEYHTDRANTAWTGTTGAKQSAIIKATDYVSNRFRIRYPKFNDEQALPFPIVYPDDTETAQMPVKMQQAVAEYAMRALTAELAPDPTTDSGGRVIETMQKVGPLEQMTKYSEGSAPVLIKPYPAADMLMRDFINTGRRVIR
jgi:hypothetical protein